MLASCTRDSCAAAAATSRWRCQPAAMSAPHVTHAATASCITSSRCQSMGEAVSPLPMTAAEHPPTPLCSRRLPLLPHHRAPLLQAPTTPHHSRAPLSHAKLASEPPSSARNRRCTEPTASFSYRGCLPVERHLRPPTCSSITTMTSARVERRSMNPESVLSTSSPACRRRFPTVDLLRCRVPTTVSPSAAYAPNRDPHLRGELPSISFPGHSPPVGQNRPASRTPVGNRGAPLFRPSGSEGPSGPGRFHRLGQALQQV
jgi:hypothetical protein